MADDKTGNVPTARELTDVVEAYFATVDRNDPPATLANMTPDCVVVYASEGQRHVGRDTGVKAYFEHRSSIVEKSWHGNFFHVADPANARVATRFDVVRTDKGVPERKGDNINVFEFEGRKIRRISVWRGKPAAS
jgi:hypothetical protein